MAENIALKDNNTKLYPKTSANLITGLDNYLDTYINEALNAESLVDITLNSGHDYLQITAHNNSSAFTVDVTASGYVTDSYWNTYEIDDIRILWPNQDSEITYIIVDADSIVGWDVTVEVSNKITGAKKRYHYEY